ncbi:MAG: magnesium and cobalt transport protein CorA, partial [Candidatus Neomarinimicrobiota bacterium]
MLRLFIREKTGIKIETVEDTSKPAEKKENILWVDLFIPTEEEIKWVEENFHIEFPSKQEMEEIEISSRYWEDEETITINAYFLIKEDENVFNETVTFILKGHTLITIRYRDLRTFREMVNRLLTNPRYYEDGYYIIAGIMEIRIDTDADTLEFITKEISKLSKIVFTGIDIT